MAEDRNVLLAPEPEIHCILPTSAGMLQLLESIPSAWPTANLDIGQAFLTAPDPQGSMERLGKGMVHPRVQSTSRRCCEDAWRVTKHGETRRRGGPDVNSKIPERMTALVLPAAGAFEIREVAVPAPGPLEVLCRIRAVAICGSDPEIVHGGQAGFWPPAYPFTPGHEWAGEVVAIGDDVTEFSVGDRVAGEAWKGCGHCYSCREGRYNLCQNYGRNEKGARHYGFRNSGAYAQYNRYSIKSIHRLPDTVSFLEGALVDTAGPAMHAADLMKITPGGTVAVIGPGPIGILAMRVAKSLGASRIIAVGRRARLEAAGRLVADVLVDFEKQDPVQAVREATAGVGPDQVFEASGAEGTLNQAIRMVKPGGQIGLLGTPADSLLEKIPFKYLCRNEIAVFGIKANPNAARKIISLIACGALVVKDLITHVFPLTDFARALETFEKRLDGAVKVVIEPNGPQAR